MRTLSFFADSKEGRDMAGDHEIKDTSGLTDADWAAINKLRRAYDSGGDEALKRAYKDLCKGDPNSLGPSHGRVFSGLRSRKA